MAVYGRVCTGIRRVLSRLGMGRVSRFPKLCRDGNRARVMAPVTRVHTVPGGSPTAVMAMLQRVGSDSVRLSLTIPFNLFVKPISTPGPVSCAHSGGDCEIGILMSDSILDKGLTRCNVQNSSN